MFYPAAVLYEAEVHGVAGVILSWFTGSYQTYPGSLSSMDSSAMFTNGHSTPNLIVSHIDLLALAALVDANLPDSVTATITLDATLTFDATGYNVFGIIPGTKYPNQYIVFGDHIDRYWNAASDDSAGVARVLGIAKAFMDSGYEPSRTLVFLCHDGEEYGVADTYMDWLTGAWEAASHAHPELVGNTVVYFNMESGGSKGATSVSAGGDPALYSFRKDVLKPLIDQYFSTHLPWSAYWYPSTYSYSQPSAWNDGFAYSAMGMPTMTVTSSRQRPIQTMGSTYHSQFETWGPIPGYLGMSAESLAMSVIGNGFAAIRLDRSTVIPYDFTTWADSLSSKLDEPTLAAAGVNTNMIKSKIAAFKPQSCLRHPCPHSPIEYHCERTQAGCYPIWKSWGRRKRGSSYYLRHRR